MSRPKGRNKVNAKGLTNEQVVVLAVSELGGQTRLVDTEDAAVEADKIAPKRFRWRKHPEHINIELVHTALRDAKRLGGLLRGAGSEGWQLTTEGLELIRELRERGIASVQPRRSVDPRERAWINRERARLLSEGAYKSFLEGGPESVSRRDAERFFRLDEYVTGEMRRARLQRFINSFADDAELGGAVKALADRAG